METTVPISGNRLVNADRQTLFILLGVAAGGFALSRYVFKASVGVAIIGAVAVTVAGLGFAETYRG